MPIYAYKCESCGFAKDVLQKLSDTPLSECPSCAASSFQKQVTSAGFQLKGTGWYVTDFKGGGTGAAATGQDKSGAAAQPGAEGKAEGKTDGNSEPASETKPKPADGTVAKKPDLAPLAGSGA